ncbi:MAG: alpha/beta fold hydrolase [Actinomycetota bacterium]
MTTIDEIPVSGGTAAAYLDGPDDASGRCLVVPPFGVSAASLEILASVLVNDGFATVRLDPRHHVGTGTGTIFDFRLSSFAEDCRRAIDRYRPTCVVAMSMGARVAMRAMSSSRHVPAAVFLVPVVDVRATLSAILRHYWFLSTDEDLPARMPVLGYEVDTPRFRVDCVRHEMVSLDGTRRDLAACRRPVVLLPGIDDPWAHLPLVEQLVASLGQPNVELRPIPCHRHDLHQDPELAMVLMDTVVAEVRRLHERTGPPGADR